MNLSPSRREVFTLAQCDEDPQWVRITGFMHTEEGPSAREGLSV